ncbi:Putative DNA repair protein RadC-like [Herminiimonas arsenicoxydans]|uniref:DNA repair protein RadC-like n=1 Tax=Herminiimonas arsenicoxydans TaxID=204773 RepID=A4G669_HERAR|nr:Putative DNA repair protein RadC-like [Herminiimonas arsenicoxydans]
MRYHKLKAGSEPGTYVMESALVTEEDILIMAKQLSRKRLNKGRALTSPGDVKEHLRALLQDHPHEVFAILLLDTQHKIIGFHEMFRGTIDSTSVYPREVAKLALEHNAAAVILTHNHPSGEPTPSQADIKLTKVLIESLALIGVRVLDHIVVSSQGCASLAERGEM